MLIIHASRADYRQRAHNFISGMSRRPDQNEVLHGRQFLIETDNNANSFLFDVEISAKKFDDLFFFLERLKHLLEALTILFPRGKVGCAFDEYDLLPSTVSTFCSAVMVTSSALKPASASEIR